MHIFKVIFGRVLTQANTCDTTKIMTISFIPKVFFFFNHFATFALLSSLLPIIFLNLLREKILKVCMCVYGCMYVYVYLSCLFSSICSISIFSKNKGSLLHNHSTVVKTRDLI